MKIAVTGGTGFIGSHLINNLLLNRFEVLVTGTNRNRAKSFSWFNEVDFVELDINSYLDETVAKIANCDKLIHLAWSGLPNYMELHHYEETLPRQYNFLKKIVLAGLKDITVTGTCFEYGMTEGALTTNMVSDPKNPYALAKDTLRKFMQEFQKKESFKFKWLRLFYMYGNGQSKESILSQLKLALENGELIFNMSGGEQLRDYLPVEEVVSTIVNIATDSRKDGIFNVCSGIPISIKSLVQNYLANSKKEIKLNLGFYAYPSYEPMNFWGIK